MELIRPLSQPVPPTIRKAPNPTALQDVASTRHLHPLPRLRRDTVHFGKIKDITGPIPPKSLIVLVPGMLSPTESVRSLGDYLRQHGHKTHILLSPYNLKAGSTLESTDWLTHNIDRIRLDESSERYVQLLKELERLPHEARLDALCDKFALKRNETGKATAKAALGLMFTPQSDYQDETDFTRIILRLRKIRQDMGGVLPDETARKQLYSLTAIARNKLRKELEKLPDLREQDGALDKTVDHVLDQIAPRVVLVGHSMGGFVSTLTLFEQMNDTAMVVTLSAPGENGTEAIPSGLGTLKQFPEFFQKRGRTLLERFAPALRHMLQNSPETQKIKADHQPFNTTIMAVGMPKQHDGLVSEQGFRMNDQLPGRINVVVTPRQANMWELASGKLDKINRLMRINPFYARTMDFVTNYSDFMKGVAYHCGLMQHHDHYWAQDGDILRGVLEAPKNKQGEYDYEQGAPDHAEALQQLRRVLHPANYEAERAHFLNVLKDTLSDAKAGTSKHNYAELVNAYAPLKSELEAIRIERQPIQDGVSDRAGEVSDLLQPDKKLTDPPIVPMSAVMTRDRTLTPTS